MGLNRCTVCSNVTPEPDTAFCSSACTDRWTREALVDVENIRAQLELEAKLTHEALRAAFEAKLTGLWN